MIKQASSIYNAGSYTFLCIVHAACKTISLETKDSRENLIIQFLCDRPLKTWNLLSSGFCCF
jgi:hypothetical protein